MSYKGALLPADLDAWSMASLFRQLRGNTHSTLLWVRTIENAYRRELGLVPRTDAAIVVATLTAQGKSEKEIADLRVIRACIGICEHFEQHRDVDHDRVQRLIGFLHDANPHRISGLAAAAGRAKGGAKAALAQQRGAADRDDKLKRAAQAILAVDPRIKIAALAATLHDRGHGGAAAIEKKLRRFGLTKNRRRTSKRPSGTAR